MWKKALILFSCLLLLSGCSLFADSGIKKDLMDQMDKLMTHHDDDMRAQRTMIRDFNSLTILGESIKQSVERGTPANQDQFNNLNSSLSKVNSELAKYKQGVDKLLTEIPNVKNTANQLKDEESKARAVKYLNDFEQATKSQKDYIDNFQNVINAYQAYFDTLSKGQIPSANSIQEYFGKESVLVKKFNSEIETFNADWKTLNQEDFNRKVKNNLSF